MAVANQSKDTTMPHGSVATAFDEADKKLAVYRQALEDVLDLALCEKSLDQHEQAKLDDFARLAANALGVCPKCGAVFAVHNGDGSCVEDEEPDETS